MKLSQATLPAILAGSFLFAGCDGGSEVSGPSPDTVPPSRTSRVEVVKASAPTSSLSLATDSVIATAALAPRWDSVAALRERADLARRDAGLIATEWLARHPVASSWTLVDSSVQAGSGTTYLVRFSVDGVSQGGLVWIPVAAAPVPVVLFGHPGDAGLTGQFLNLFGLLLGPIKGQSILVAPAYRGETATLGTSSVGSDSLAASPWDRDVDDGLAFLQAVLDHFPKADANRIAAVGYSRGAGVSLLSGIRDSRIGGVFEVAGPADFFAPSVQRVGVTLAQGGTIDLPGLDYLEAHVLAPFRSGAIPADSVRRELLRRSPARLALAGGLPFPVEVVHGLSDTTVHPDQSRALLAAKPDAVVKFVPGANHTNILQSATVAIELQSFLQSHLGL